MIRKNVKRYMKGYRMSLNKLSVSSGISKSTLSDFLSGKIECLTAGKIGLIADALEVPIERLFVPEGVGVTAETAIEGM